MSRLGRTVSPLPSCSVTVCLCLVLVSVMVKVTGGVASGPMDPDTLLHCHQDQECRPIVSCPPVLDLVRDVKDDAATSPWRLNIVHVVRDRICGHVAKRKVCCPKKHLKQVRRNCETGNAMPVWYFGRNRKYFIKICETFRSIYPRSKVTTTT